MLDLRTRAAAVLVALLSACGSSPPPAASPPRIELARAQPLSPLARELLEPRMRRHGATLVELQAAVVSVDYARVAAAVRALRAEPRLSRPTGASDTVNDAVPATFFDLQDELVRATDALAAAAAAHDDAAMAAAVGQVTSTCVTCHALYRRM